MAEQEKTLELKRIVMVKAVVTEAFKENLVRELERAVRNLDTQGLAMENQSKTYLEDLKKKGIKQIAFDRGGYLYHGRVKAFADSIRKGGIQF